MSKSISHLFLAIVVFGSFFGLVLAYTSDATFLRAFTLSYVFNAVLWGGIILNNIIISMNAKAKTRFLLMILLAIAASTTPFLLYITIDESTLTENITIVTDGNQSTYIEYPVNGYQLLGILIFIFYFVSGLSQWFFRWRRISRDC